MRRYIPIGKRRSPKADSESDFAWFPYDSEPQSLTVVEMDETPRATGVLDAQGNELFAVEERERVGFVRFAD